MTRFLLLGARMALTHFVQPVHFPFELRTGSELPDSAVVLRVRARNFQLKTRGCVSAPMWIRIPGMALLDALYPTEQAQCPARNGSKSCPPLT
jgi:hypothetical protein